MQTLLLLLQSPEVEVLGITVVSGNQWRHEEVAHTLSLLEIIGTDIPVVPEQIIAAPHLIRPPKSWFRCSSPGQSITSSPLSCQTSTSSGVITFVANHYYFKAIH
jgi:inosine-uridine nucleoside N-ribohydrolase